MHLFNKLFLNQLFNKLYHNLLYNKLFNNLLYNKLYNNLLFNKQLKERVELNMYHMKRLYLNMKKLDKEFKYQKKNMSLITMQLNTKPNMYHKFIKKNIQVLFEF